MQIFSYSRNGFSINHTVDEHPDNFNFQMHVHPNCELYYFVSGKGYYTVEGKQYHHIIHPNTLMPAEGFVSVSVVCKDSALGDCLSTALFCMSAEEGSALIESLQGVEAMWINQSGEKTVSSGWDTYIK